MTAFKVVRVIAILGAALFSCPWSSDASLVMGGDRPECDSSGLSQTDCGATSPSGCGLQIQQCDGCLEGVAKKTKVCVDGPAACDDGGCTDDQIHSYTSGTCITDNCD